MSETRKCIGKKIDSVNVRLSRGYRVAQVNLSLIDVLTGPMIPTFWSKVEIMREFVGGWWVDVFSTLQDEGGIADRRICIKSKSAISLLD
jgi:hypothetical protein